MRDAKEKKRRSELKWWEGRGTNRLKCEYIGSNAVDGLFAVMVSSWLSVGDCSATGAIVAHDDSMEAERSQRG